MANRHVLCFDISTGGLAGAVFDENLQASNFIEIPWAITMETGGAAVLDVDVFNRTLIETAGQVCAAGPPNIDAISFSAFMHSCILLDGNLHPASPILTWLDRRGREGVDLIRRLVGARFHTLTGCRYHPMFPVFKLASLKLPDGVRVASAKSLAIAQLTGSWVEDHGTASATGLYDIRLGTWCQEILDAIALPRSALFSIVERDTIAGGLTSEAAARLGLTSGIPVIAGSGDGFLANTGSGCDEPTRMSATLGTSCSVRQLLSLPVFDEAAGTFCYRAGNDAFLLGCAGSNGGNVLDWAKSVFGGVPAQSSNRDLPIFIPLLNGERSPDWNEQRTASWHGIHASHTAADLAAAVTEGVVFNLAHYVDILERASGVLPKEIILSGNGFLNPLTAEILATLAQARVLAPRTQGLASLRGAAICGFQALGINTSPAIERIVAESELVTGEADSAAIRQRYARYRELRGPVPFDSQR